MFLLGGPENCWLITVIYKHRFNQKVRHQTLKKWKTHINDQTSLPCVVISTVALCQQLWGHLAALCYSYPCFFCCMQHFPSEHPLLLTDEGNSVWIGDVGTFPCLQYRNSTGDCAYSTPVYSVHLRLSAKLPVIPPTENLMILQLSDVSRRTTAH